jgi:hypothetical protein
MMIFALAWGIVKQLITAEKPLQFPAKAPLFFATITISNGVTVLQLILLYTSQVRYDLKRPAMQTEYIIDTVVHLNCNLLPRLKAQVSEFK